VGAGELAVLRGELLLRHSQLLEPRRQLFQGLYDQRRRRRGLDPGLLAEGQDPFSKAVHLQGEIGEIHLQASW